MNADLTEEALCDLTPFETTVSVVIATNPVTAAGTFSATARGTFVVTGLYRHVLAIAERCSAKYAVIVCVWIVVVAVGVFVATAASAVVAGEFALIDELLFYYYITV